MIMQTSMTNMTLRKVDGEDGVFRPLLKTKKYYNLQFYINHLTCRILYVIMNILKWEVKYGEINKKRV